MSKSETPKPSDAQRLNEVIILGKAFGATGIYDHSPSDTDAFRKAVDDVFSGKAAEGSTILQGELGSVIYREKPSNCVTLFLATVKSKIFGANH